MIISMFFRWINILKYLRFNTKLSNLIMIITNVIKDLMYLLKL